FMSDPNVLGRTMTVDGTIYTIIGVMPATFDMLPANVDVFRPTDFVDQMDRHDSRNYLVLGRLFPGADAAAVQRELAGVSARLASEHPDANRGWELHSAPVRSFFPGPTDRRLFSVMTAVTIFALLIACANVANLLLARAESRQKEIAVRTAMGAGRHRILRQLLTESVVMGAVAGVIGSILAIWVVRWLQTSMPAELPATLMPVLSPRVVVATLAVSVMAGIVFGMAPAIHAARADLREALGEGARGGTAGRSRKRIRNAFVVSEFAVALALLTTSGILVEAFDRMSNADPGFDTEGLLTLEVSIGDDRYPSDTEVWTYQEELIRALEHVPGVGGVALMSSLPRSRSNPQSRYTVDGRPVPDPSEQPTVSTQAVNPSYFDAMGIPLLQGRTFGEVDGPEGQPVMVVSRSFAEREFPGEDPLGRSVTVGDESRVIVGVADDVLQERLALAGEGGQGIYVPAAQGPERNPAIAVRSTLETGALSDAVRRAVWSVNPDQPLARVRTLESHVAESLAGPRSISIFLGVIGGIALLLAAMGIYGVMSHSVTQQKREIGIRMALGAGRGAVVGMITRSGMLLAGVGMAVGVPLAWVIQRMISQTLNVFENGGGPTFALASIAVLALTASLATYLPARRASTVPPVVALTGE
ncbi:MAG: ABC transporter permease, partial [Gemmatimonadota bacterium]|nr:ABC transporter permease [Gemmatimonadota bacterium]